AEITTRHLNSLHNTLDGHRLSLVNLMGQEAGMARFNTCTSCHASCTDCHMKQPDRYNRLVPRTESHQFTRRPSSKVCRVCHGQTGETFFGGGEKSEHGASAMAKAGLECMDCHSEGEIHGSGKRNGFIGQTVKPNCEKCHASPGGKVTASKGTLSAMQYNPKTAGHSIHPETVSCVACHTKWYTNCWDCHKGKAREEKGKFFLAIHPTTGKVHTATHVPINRELGNVSPDLGGWAVKTRHSWGKAQACEQCHTDPETYINPALRQAPFVGFWATEQARGAFVDEKLVKLIRIDQEGLAKSVHHGLSCPTCHASPGNETCSGCHTRRAGKSGPRATYQKASGLLQSSKHLLEKEPGSVSDLSSWKSRWAVLRERYLRIGNEFHSKPWPAGKQMEEFRGEAEKFYRDIRTALKNNK
ncbi:MAG TPA: hypothetical protein VK564_13575, partial [Thermodesulfobacteriota bacterium]|nr:hypothetical protein [Thermodesulfobacteriota bacterium]